MKEQKEKESWSPTSLKEKNEKGKGLYVGSLYKMS